VKPAFTAFVLPAVCSSCSGLVWHPVYFFSSALPALGFGFRIFVGPAAPTQPDKVIYFGTKILSSPIAQGLNMLGERFVKRQIFFRFHHASEISFDYKFGNPLPQSIDSRHPTPARLRLSRILHTRRTQTLALRRRALQAKEHTFVNAEIGTFSGKNPARRNG
jgi:hypothetical protein